MQYRSTFSGHSASSRTLACAFRRSRRVGTTSGTRRGAGEAAEEEDDNKGCQTAASGRKGSFPPQQQDEETETTVLYQETAAEDGEICESHARRERSHFEGASVVMNM